MDSPFWLAQMCDSYEGVPIMMEAQQHRSTGVGGS